jgi:hypothetical protein
VKLINISSETDLREWLTEQANYDTSTSLQWVEPAKFGSTTGACDAIMKHRDHRVDLELKYLYRTRKGIKFTVRPSQRRYHRMTMKRGGRTALLCVENGSKRLFLVRGDHVPLRDYASDFAAQCGPDEDITMTVPHFDEIIIRLFYDSDYWR